MQKTFTEERAELLSQYNRGVYTVHAYSEGCADIDRRARKQGFTLLNNGKGVYVKIG